MKRSFLLLIGPALAFAAYDPYAAALFQKNCATCHQAGGEAAARIPQYRCLRPERRIRFCGRSRVES